jgi:hypothetical protein
MAKRRKASNRIVAERPQALGAPFCWIIPSPATPPTSKRRPSRWPCGPAGCGTQRASYTPSPPPSSTHPKKGPGAPPGESRGAGGACALRCILLDDADARVSCGHDALALRQARPRPDGARGRRACRPPPSAADLYRRPRPARHCLCVPVLSKPSDRVVDVMLPASVWELGRSTQRESRRRRHHAVGVASGQRPWCHYTSLALQVRWPHAPSAVPTCRHRSAPVTTCRHPLPVGSWEEPLAELLT